MSHDLFGRRALAAATAQNPAAAEASGLAAMARVAAACAAESARLEDPRLVGLSVQRTPAPDPNSTRLPEA